MINRIEVFKKTKDNWSPNFSIGGWGGEYANLVLVTFHGNIASPNELPTFRVSVWGADDTGYDKDFEIESLAYACFVLITEWDYVNIQDVEDIGLRVF